MKKGATVFARGVVYLIGIGALAVCLILLPELVREEGVGKPNNPIFLYAFFAGVYSLAAIFFIALYQSHKLLNYIDSNKAFSNHSINALRNIKTCAIIFSVLVAVEATTGIITARIMDPTEDVTGFITLGFLFTLISSVIAVFIALLQKLLEDAVALKSENDLIV